MIARVGIAFLLVIAAVGAFLPPGALPTGTVTAAESAGKRLGDQDTSLPTPPPKPAQVRPASGTSQAKSGAGRVGPPPNRPAASSRFDAIRPGFDTTVFGPNDDGTYPCIGPENGMPQGCTPTTVPLGFTINFFGQDYSDVYVNNNGNLTFDSPLATYTPFSLLSTSHVIIAPFFADIDTRVGPVVTFGNGTVNNRPAFGVTWPGVGCFNQNDTVQDTFQVVLINRDDRHSGDFDIEFDYDQVTWDSGQASGGDATCQGGSSARAGYSNGSDLSLELPGSGVNGAFLDTNPDGLVHRSFNSLQPGRYVFEVTNGRTPTGGTISGEVTAGTTNSPVASAFVQVCGTLNSCLTTQTTADGHYSAVGLPDDTYTITAFPPEGANYLPGTLSGVTIQGGSSVNNANVALGAPTAPPVGTTITNCEIGGDGIPIVYWEDPLTLTTKGCPGGTATYQILENGSVLRGGPMTEHPAGTYTATIPALFPNYGDALVRIVIQCPGGAQTSIPFNIYIDPSGKVKTVSGVPVAGATVTLLRSDSSSGPFTAVPNGSGIMDLVNRNNPDTTDTNGRFGWNVVAGYYEVQASHAGCYAPGNPSQTVVQSGILTVPPAVTNLVLTLDCPGIKLHIFLPVVQSRSNPL